ncbi:MAG: hypothetical protein QW166_03945 [Candidatus Bathyarchaeia archaeon]
MKTTALPFCVLCFVLICFQSINIAYGYPTVEVPPKVKVTETIVNASISRAYGKLWAKIDAEYKVQTIYAYGDSYLTENYGMGLVLYPDLPYLQATVTQDILEFHYPVPLDSANISVCVDGKEISVKKDAHGYYHLFDADLAEINWTIAPVPKKFVVKVHYEQPVSETTATYAYLGDYALTLPLYGRLGCSNISYPLYSWYGYPPNNYRVQIETCLSTLHVYLIDSQGVLTSLNRTAFISEESGKWFAAFTIEEATFVHGAVAVFNASSEENWSSQAVPILVTSALLFAALIAAVLIYLVKFRARRQIGR